MLPPVGRFNDAVVLSESGARLGRLAMMAGDGTTHHNPYYPSWIGYPTRPNSAAWFITALTPDPDAGENYDRGFSLRQLFNAGWLAVDADPGDDFEAKALLSAYYERILDALPDRVWVYTPENIATAVTILASAEPDSLWTVAVMRAFPEHPQTPGSPKWIAEEEKAQAQGRQAHHESDPNPFTD